MEPSPSLTSMILFWIMWGVGGLRSLLVSCLTESLLGSLKVTKAKPLLFPVFLSLMMATSTTFPYYAKYLSISLSTTMLWVSELNRENLTFGRVENTTNEVLWELLFLFGRLNQTLLIRLLHSPRSGANRIEDLSQSKYLVKLCQSTNEGVQIQHLRVSLVLRWTLDQRLVLRHVHRGSMMMHLRLLLVVVLCLLCNSVLILILWT